MKKRKSGFTPLTAVLLAASLALLAFASINAARAAVSVFSDTYRAGVELQDIGITLMEGTSTEDLKDVAHRNYNRRENADRTGDWNEGSVELLSHLKDKEIQFGEKYDEVLAVKNSGTIDQYVRLTVYCYWLDEKGKKMHDTAFTPDLIELHFLPDDEGYNGPWVEDKAAATSERRVFYYQDMLPAGGDSITEPLTDTISISPDTAFAVNYVGTTAYNYKDKTFIVEATADAVQDHNADQAKVSVWGQDI